jgi:hypothetical protein
VAGKNRPSDKDYATAVRLGLLGLTAAQNLDEIMNRLVSLHPKNNTFPAEVLLELAADAIAESGASPTDSIQYEGIGDRYLPEFSFRGKSKQHKSHYALMASRDDRGRRGHPIGTGLWPGRLSRSVRS